MHNISIIISTISVVISACALLWWSSRIVKATKYEHNIMLYKELKILYFMILGLRNVSFVPPDNQIKGIVEDRRKFFNTDLTPQAQKIAKDLIIDEIIFGKKNSIRSSYNEQIFNGVLKKIHIAFSLAGQEDDPINKFLFGDFDKENGTFEVMDEHLMSEVMDEHLMSEVMNDKIYNCMKEKFNKSFSTLEERIRVFHTPPYKSLFRSITKFTKMILSCKK